MKTGILGFAVADRHYSSKLKQRIFQNWKGSGMQSKTNAMADCYFDLKLKLKILESWKMGIVSSKKEKENR